MNALGMPELPSLHNEAEQDAPRQGLQPRIAFRYDKNTFDAAADTLARQHGGDPERLESELDLLNDQEVAQINRRVPDDIDDTPYPPDTSPPTIVGPRYWEKE